MSARVQPGGRAEIGRVNHGLARIVGAASGGDPPRVLTTLARHRRLFRPWLRFASRLMPGGLLPRRETELLILRVAHNCDSEYEWSQHERIAFSAGVDAAEVERVREGADAEGWSERERLLLRAADELHERRTISDAVWTPLSAVLSEPELIEVCMLVGHYEMLAMTLNALAVEPDPVPVASGRGLRLMRAVNRRRARRGARRQ